jgi:hypothetical protein
MARYGFDVREIHVGLAVARSRDRQALARQHALNDAYRQQVLADGGKVLLGELHQKSSGPVQEKMVDSACCVRITRYVDEIAHGRSRVEAILVLSKDIDLQPAIDYAVESRVPIFVVAQDVVQHRPHPYLLVGPSAYAEITSSSRGPSGHELREELATMLFTGGPSVWTVKKAGASFLLEHASGLRGRMATGVPYPNSRGTVTLHPVDVEFSAGAFPRLVCDHRPSRRPMWSTAVVLGRAAPMGLKVKVAGGAVQRPHYPQGGVVPGDTVLLHTATGRVLGRIAQLCASRQFDPDAVSIVRVISALPRGGALVADGSGRRGLLNTDQKVGPGQRLAVAQIGLTRKGPVWVATSSPLS